MDERENIDYEFTASTSQVSQQITGLISTLTGLRKMVNNVASSLRSASAENKDFAATAKTMVKETSAISKGLSSSISTLTGMRKNVNTVGKDIRSTASEMRAMSASSNSSTASSNSAGNAFKLAAAKLGSLASSSKSATAALKASANGINSMGEEAEDAEKDLDKLDRKSITLAATIGSTLSRAFDRAFQSISNMLRGAVANSIDYIEVTNLLTVALGDQADEAERYADTIEETFGSDSAEIKRSIGTLNQLTKTMGTTASQAEWMSQNFVNAGLDLSSLWNVSLSQTLEAIESSLSGLPKSMRTLFGIDTSATALEALALAHGLDVTYANLNRANKAALVYIAIMRGASSANGDLAKTIETPANQLKIFTQQVVIFGRTFADFFLGVISGALPYLNAILMTLTAIMRTFAGLMGIAEGDFIGAFSSASSDVDDLGDSIEDAEDKAQSFLAPFDELNVFKPEESDSDLGDFGAGGGIDPELLAIMEQYENKLEDVTMKATELRDKWMEVLGFTKLVDEETGEISWKFEGLTTTSATILGIVGALVGLLVGSKLVAIIGGITSAFTKLSGAATGASVATSGVGGATAVASASFGTIALAIMFVIAIIYILINQWENLVESAKHAIEGLKLMLSGFVSFIGGWIKALTGDVEGGFEDMKTGIGLIFQGILHFIIGLAGAMSSIIMGALNFIIAMINTVIGALNAVIRLSNKVGGTNFGEIGTVASLNWEMPTVDAEQFLFAARGGSFKGGQPFVAGEHGKMEAVGNYKGKTTVMPLENTSFSKAIGSAVYDAVSSAMGSNNSEQPINVYIGNDKLDSYIYTSYNKTERNRGSRIFGGALNEQFI